MFEVLPGFRDFTPAACAVRNAIFTKWRSTARIFNFEEFDGPVLESLELFTKKSGEEITEQLFNFEDKGGRQIALRPEMTPSLVRILGKNLAVLKKPTKWFNITENFRYERPQKGRLRSFYQFNADIIGEETFSADAELIALAIQSFKNFGLTREHFYVRLSDRQLWMLWLQGFGIKNFELAQKVLAVCDKLERKPCQVIEDDLSKILPESISPAVFYKLTQRLRSSETLTEIRTCFQELMEWKAVTEVLEHRLVEFERLLQRLQALQCDEYVSIDLNIVRGLAYYTGFVFEVFEVGGQGRALAGGGRYDQLFEKLTGHAMPAVGFAAGDVTLTDILEKNRLLPAVSTGVDVFVIFDEIMQNQALQWAQNFRCAGYVTSYHLGEVKSITKQLKKAFSEGARNIVIFTQEAVMNGKAQVRYTMDKTETTVNISELLQVIR